MKPNKIYLTGLGAMAILALSACGGGGSSPAAEVKPDSLSGNALTGAPLVGANVTVKDKLGTNCATGTSDTKGAWTANLNNCAGAPYLLKVVGASSAGAPVTFFSAATDADVNKAGAGSAMVNVSQLTDAIVKVLLKTDAPDAVPASKLQSDITASNLQTTSQNTLAALVPPGVLSTYGTGDVRTMAVVPGSGTGLDGLHDSVPTIEVTVSGGTLNVVATVTNVNADGATAVTATTVATTAAATAPLVPPADGTVINGVVVTTPTTVATADPEVLVKGEVTQMLKEWDKVYATALPANNTAAFAFSDACYLDDGFDKPTLLARWADTSDTIRDASKYRIGATRSNLIIVPMSLKVISNADGSKMRIVKVKYDISYTDGTTTKQALNTLVFGNSAKACVDDSLAGTGENRTAWRFLGNRRQVETNVNPVNVQYKKFSLADGSAIPTGDYRQNRLEFGIYDYRQKGYTYAVVKGQGLPISGIKLLMSMTMKNAPELQGKAGAYTNNTPFEGARICSYKNTAGTAFYDADQADCIANGGGSNHWYFSDTGLAALSVGQSYTFELYKGNGWMTVNGQNSETPNATYSDSLPAVPYNATQFPSTGFANFGSTGTTLAEAITMIKGVGGTATFSPVNVSGLPADANPIARRTIWGFSSGKALSTDAHNNLRQIKRTYPNNTDAVVTETIPSKLAAMSIVSYAELGFSSNDRNGRSINTIYYFQ